MSGDADASTQSPGAWAPTRRSCSRRCMASMADAVYAVDDAGVVLFANAAAVSILGYASESELIGRPSHATIHHSHPDGRPFPEADCPLLAPRQTGEPVRVEQDWFIRRDGSFVPVAYSSAPVTVERPARRGGGLPRHLRAQPRRGRAAARRGDPRLARADRPGRSGGAPAAGPRPARRRSAAADQRDLRPAGRGPRSAGDASHVRAIADALEETQLAIRDLRDLGAGLDPSVLAHRGLAAAITSLTARTPVPVTLDAARTAFPAAGREHRLLRRLRGAGQRGQARAGVRGGGARSRPRSDRLVVTVTDDGRGGAVAGSRRRLGPRRAGRSRCGGGRDVGVESPAGAGTAITAELPLQRRRQRARKQGEHREHAAMLERLVGRARAWRRSARRASRLRRASRPATRRSRGLTCPRPSAPAPGARGPSAPPADRACGGGPPSARRSRDRAPTRPAATRRTASANESTSAIRSLSR